MELLSADSEIVSGYFSEIENILNTIVNASKNYKPMLDGERYLTGEEVCEILHLSKRTLKEYRDSGKLSFISLPGKILYNEKEIMSFLERNNSKAWN